MIRWTLIFIVLCCVRPSLAQVALRGQIVAPSGPLAFATLSVYTPDSLLVTGATTDLDGHFQTDLFPGDYRLVFSYLGYTPRELSLTLAAERDLGAIQLLEASEELSEVLVTARRQLVERRFDRLVVNVSESPAAAGSDLVQVLKLAPGIQLQDNRLELVGRGNLRVMVNDRLIALEGAELIAFLAGIAAEDIERVEIISNPPARYAAEGKGGLINIVYKGGRQHHWKNQSTLTYERNRYDVVTLRNRFSYRKERSSLLCSWGGSRGSQWHTEYGTTKLAAGPWQWESQLRMRRDEFHTHLTFDQDLNARLRVGVQYQGQWAQPRFRGPIETQIFDAQQNLDSILLNRGIDDRQRQHHLLNLHLTADLDSSGRRLTIDLDGMNYQNHLDLDYVIETLDADREALRLHRAGANVSRQQIRNYSFKADMVHPWRQWAFDYGLRYSQIRSHNDLQVYRDDTGRRHRDSQQSNAFTYHEQTWALYASASREWGTAWRGQLGLRVEQTQTEGVSPQLGQRHQQGYRQLFPTFYLRYQPREQHQLALSLGRRINRPGFRDLNPFRVYLNNKSYSEGNPFLQASTTGTFEVTHVYRGRFSTNAFVQRTTNGFGTLFTADDETQIQATLRANYYSAVHFGLGEQWSFDPAPWWSSQNQLYLFYRHTDIVEASTARARNGAQLYLSTSNRVHFVRDWAALLDFWCAPEHRCDIFEVGVTYSLDVALRKKWSNQRWSVSVQASDVLNTASLWHLASEVNGVRNTYGQNYGSRRVRLTLSYAFGNERVEVSWRSFGNQEERDRS